MNIEELPSSISRLVKNCFIEETIQRGYREYVFHFAEKESKIVLELSIDNTIKQVFDIKLSEYLQLSENLKQGFYVLEDYCSYTYVASNIRNYVVIVDNFFKS